MDVLEKFEKVRDEKADFIKGKDCPEPREVISYLFTNEKYPPKVMQHYSCNKNCICTQTVLTHRATINESIYLHQLIQEI